MSLSIIIVNYKTPGLLHNCLKSIYRFTKGIEYEIIVVDNNSNDDSKSLITAEFTGVQWVQMDYNSGFARANNEGIKRASGDAILLLNSDTLIIDNAIADCYNLLMSSSYVACGVQLINEDSSPQISGSFFMKGSLNNLLPVPYLGHVLKWAANTLKMNKAHLNSYHSNAEVQWINGAFLMVKTEIIKKAGLLDEDFFLYAEEAEWCYRLGKYGKMVIYGKAQVVHLQGETANTAFNSSGKGYYNLYDRKGLQIMLSNFVRIRKQNGIVWFLFHLFVYTFAIPVYFIFELFICALTLDRNTNYRLMKVFKYARNVFILWWYSPIILLNKPFFYKVI